MGIMHKLTSVQITALRSQVKANGTNYETAAWDFAEALAKVKCFYTEAGTRIYETWGYSSFKEYCKAEVSKVEPGTAANYAEAYFTMMVVISAPRTRAFARDVGFSKCRRVYTLVDNDNVTAWLEFANTHTQKELTAAVKVANKVDTLRSDPERALVRANRTTAPTRATFQIPANRANRDLAASAANLVRRVTRDDSVSKERCIMKCVEQFLALVRQGRAGVGWTMAE